MHPFKLIYGEDILPLVGEFPAVGSQIPSFMLVDGQFNDVALAQFASTPKAIITLLSFDEHEHGGMRLLRETLRRLERWPWLQTIAISVDSPSTLRRVRHEHGLPGVQLLSTLRGRDFHKHFGVLITEYPLAGYTAPAIIIADADNTVLYSERLRDTLDDFRLDEIARVLQGIAAAEEEARRLAEENARKAEAEAAANERMEQAAVDAGHTSPPR
jgi:thioredoxin-dependent peroxiredoxin